MANILAAILVLGVLAAGTVSLLGDSYWTGFSPGPAFMPYWVAGFGVVIASLLILQTMAKAAPREEPADFSDFGQAGMLVVLLFALVLLTPVLGMLVGAVLMMLVFLIGMKRRPVTPSLITTGATAAIVYCVFETWLHVDLPKGMVGF